MPIIKNEYEARIVYKVFSGECFDENGNVVIIKYMPDDSGVYCEDDNGEYFKKYGELFVDDALHKKIVLMLEEDV